MSGKKGAGSASSSSGSAASLDEATLTAIALKLKELNAGSQRDQLHNQKWTLSGHEADAVSNQRWIRQVLNAAYAHGPEAFKLVNQA